MTTEYQPPEQSKKKSAVTVSRIILVLILIAALAALGFDFLAKRSMNAAYERLDRLNDEAEKTLKGVSKSTVRQEVGQEPADAKNQAGGILIEHYDFQGVFYKHRLVVEYQTSVDKSESMRSFEQKSVLRFSGE